MQGELSSISHISRGPTRRRVESKNATISLCAPTEIKREKGRVVFIFHSSGSVLRNSFLFYLVGCVPARVLWWLLLHMEVMEDRFSWSSLTCRLAIHSLPDFRHQCCGKRRNYNWRYTDKTLFVLLVYKRKQSKFKSGRFMKKNTPWHWMNKFYQQNPHKKHYHQRLQKELKLKLKIVQNKKFSMKSNCIKVLFWNEFFKIFLKKDEKQ